MFDSATPRDGASQLAILADDGLNPARPNAQGRYRDPAVFPRLCSLIVLQQVRWFHDLFRDLCVSKCIGCKTKGALGLAG